MSRRASSSTLRFAGVVLSLAAVPCCAFSPPIQGQSIWELTPYRVRLHVTVDPILNIGGRFQQRLVDRLVDRCDAVIGATWNVEVAPAEDTTHRDLANWLTAPANEPQMESVPKGSDELFDKLFLIHVREGPLGYRIGCREFDARTRIWSPTIRATAAQPARLVDTAFEAMLAAFAPLAKIDKAEKKEATLRLRGGALPRPDDSWNLLRPGDLLRPLMRFNQRDGAPRKILPIAWTYLLVESIDASVAHCQIHSGLRNPLSSRTRGRIDRLALLIHPEGESTNLQLVTRGDRDSPLEGYQVYAHPAQSKTTTWLGESDANGNVRISSDGHALRILLVKHGGDFLARLPLAPGFVTTAVAEIPNDDERLEVVGIITGLQESLVDLVVRREMLMLRLRAAIEAGDFDQANEIVGHLHDVQLDEDRFRSRLRQRQQAIVSNNPYVQRKIDKMFGDTSKLMASYFDPRPMLKLEAELSRTRRAAEEEAPTDETPEVSEEPTPASAS